MDVRPDGVWRFIVEDPSGWKVVLHGVYQAVDRPKRIVQTFMTEDQPGKGHLETTTFEALDDKTGLTVNLLFESVEDRDMVVSYGAVMGTNQTYARLDMLLSRLAEG